MNRILIILLAASLIYSCSNPTEKTTSEPEIEVDPTEALVDSILWYKKALTPTDIVSRQIPNITRKEALAIQLEMLKAEQAEGKKLIGYKMGGTVVPDSASFDPVYGYMLDSNIIEEDSTVLAQNFYGGSVMVEGEVGFAVKRDFKDGVASMEELKEGVDYVFNAIEFVNNFAIPIEGQPESATLSHVAAAGLNHCGIIIGQGRASVDDFDFENEKVVCYIDGELKAEGGSFNIYGNPLNALYGLINVLSENGSYLRKGDIVITGSLYQNPLIDSTSAVSVKFSTLGDISFKMK